MKLRKLIAILASAVLLCSVLPLGMTATVSAANDNLVVNGGFETGDLTGWINNGYSPTITTEQAHSGSYSLKTSRTANQYQTMIKGANMTVEANTDYKITFWYYYAGETANAAFYLYVKGGGTNTNVSAAYPQASVANTWRMATLKFNSGDYTTVNLLLQNRTVNAGGSYYFDDFILIKDEVTTDGYLTNGDYETGDLTGWVNSGYSPTITTELAHGGNYSLKTSRTGAKYQTMIKSADITVEQNTDYKITFWYYYTGEATDASFYLYVKNGNTNVANIYPSASEVNTWKQATISFNSGSYTSLYLILQNRTANSGGSYYFDDFVMTKVIPPSYDGYLYNGNFECGTTAKWTLKWSPNVTAAITNGRDGGKGVQVNAVTQWSCLSQKITVAANTNYQVTAWAKDATNMTLLVKNGDNSANIKEVYTKPGSEWTRYVVQFNSGSETAVNILLMGSVAGASGVFDDISVIPLCDTCTTDAATIYEAGECTVCGGDVPAANLPFAFGGNSASEDVQGLAFSFTVAADGINVINGNVADYSAATVDGYTLIGMGAKAANTKDEIDIPCVYLMDLEADSAAFAVRVINIPEANLGDDITVTPYIIVEIDGVATTIYGDVQTAAYNDYI